jgi:sec-independent protein translocase protein TatA
MPQVGPFELLTILLIVIMIFGVGKLPEVGSALGKGIREFRNASSGGNSADGKPKPKAD